MSDPSNVARSLRDRLAGSNEDRLGRALSDLLESPLLTGAIGRAFDAREKAAQAQELAMGALNIPSAADIERLTRRLRSVSHRLEGIEDGVDRLDRAFAPSALETRLASIEEQLRALSARLEQADAGAAAKGEAAKATKRPATAKAPAAKASAAKAVASGKRKGAPARKGRGGSGASAA
jgi:anti-sigma-K factor RskA